VELEAFLAMKPAEAQAFVRELAAREWQSMAEIEQLEAESDELRGQLQAKIGELVGKELKAEVRA